MMTRCITGKGLIQRDKTTSFTRERRSPLLADGLEYFQVSLILFELRKGLHKTARENQSDGFFLRWGWVL